MTLKVCKKCHIAKPDIQFYQTGAYRRSECKQCTITANTNRNHVKQIWKTRYGGDDDLRKQKSREYYAANKAKFKDYRLQFKQRQSDKWRKDKS